MALLEINNIEIDYGVIKAIKNVSMKVEKGTIVAILGANGAGKSTLIRSVSGAVKISKGEILFNGEKINGLPSYKIAAMNIMPSPEGRLILSGLSVEENLLVGSYSLKTITKDGVKISKKERIERLLSEVYAYFPILEERKKQQAQTLSGGEQQMLAIGRALMGDPELLLLDEPSLGLAPMIVKDIFDIIEKIKEEGKTILIVEQNAFQTLKIADYAYVLELGQVNMEGKASELLNNEKLINAYLGKKH